jgi:hypothetical protein
MRTYALYRMAAVGPALGAATVFRTSVGWLDVWSKHGPQLVKSGLEAWEPESGAEDAEKKFNDELIAIAREATDVYVKQVQQGIKDLETFSQPPKGGGRKRGSSAKRPTAAAARKRSKAAGKASARSTTASRGAGKPRGAAKRTTRTRPR